MSLNFLSQDPTKGLVLKQSTVKEKGDDGGEKGKDSDDNDGDDDDEEEEDSDEEEEEERDTSTEGPSSSQDDSAEKPSEETPSPVSVIFLIKCCKFLPLGGADIEQCNLPKGR